MSQDQKDLELQQIHPEQSGNLDEKRQFIGNKQQSLQAHKFSEITEEASKKLTCYEKILQCFGTVTGCLRTWLPCICCWFKYPYIENEDGNVVLLEKFGKLNRKLEGGLHYFNTMTDKVYKINMKTQIIDLVRQIILTNDNITVNIDAIVYFRIFDPVRCQYRLQDPRQAVAEITFAALRTVCGEYTLQQILEKREEISEKLEQFLFEEVKMWGIVIEAAFVKDLVLSQDLQNNLSAVAKAKRLSEAKIISADSDVQAAKMLREAADLLDSDAAMQIRYFETLSTLSKERCPKVMFLPINDKTFEKK